MSAFKFFFQALHTWKQAKEKQVASVFDTMDVFLWTDYETPTTIKNIIKL